MAKKKDLNPMEKAQAHAEKMRKVNAKSEAAELARQKKQREGAKKKKK